MIYLQALRKAGDADEEQYPLSAAVCRRFTRVEFDRPVTVIVGENGTGKTTLMEIMAAKLQAVAISDGFAAARPRDEAFTRSQAVFRVEMAKRPSRNFFFKAEDFTRYIDAWRRMDEEAREGLEDVNRRFADRSDYARGLASMPYHRTLGEMNALYEGDITGQSHGESFLTFFGGRITEGGLYLLDEPEAALSYPNQLVLLHLIHEALRRNCQLILSTHSPVLAACPGARIYEIRDAELCPTEYDDLSSVSFLRSFLSDRRGYLRHMDV